MQFKCGRQNECKWGRRYKTKNRNEIYFLQAVIHIQQYLKKSPNAKNAPCIVSEAVTIVMVIVTIVFIVSFLPYLTLIVWRVVKRQHAAEFLFDAGLVWFKIGTRSCLFNCSLNPWIYGNFNSNYRQFVFRWMCRKR